MNFIKKFFKNHEFQTECEIRAVDLWQEVDIDFLDDEKRRNETSFDVKNVLSKSGQSELSILFDDFCSENNLRHPEIISVTDWQEIPNGYLLRKFKTFAEEKIIKLRPRRTGSYK